MKNWLTGYNHAVMALSTSGRGRPKKFGRPARSVTLTLPNDVIDRLGDLNADLGRAVVIHAREADEEAARILDNHPGVTAILHSFSSGMSLLRAGLVHRHYVSFSGMVTFKNWRLDEAIRETPLDRLLLETDGPYLAPVPHRGKRNEPAFVGHVAGRLATVRGIPVEELIAQTGENAKRVFQLQ